MDSIIKVFPQKTFYYKSFPPKKLQEPLFQWFYLISFFLCTKPNSLTVNGEPKSSTVSFSIFLKTPAVQYFIVLNILGTIEKKMLRIQEEAFHHCIKNILSCIVYFGLTAINPWCRNFKKLFQTLIPPKMHLIFFMLFLLPPFVLFLLLSRVLGGKICKEILSSFLIHTSYSPT